MGSADKVTTPGVEIFTPGLVVKLTKDLTGTRPDGRHKRVKAGTILVVHETFATSTRNAYSYTESGHCVAVHANEATVWDFRY